MIGKGFEINKWIAYILDSLGNKPECNHYESDFKDTASQ